jgi:endoglycosylceramidase
MNRRQPRQGLSVFLIATIFLGVGAACATPATSARPTPPPAANGAQDTHVHLVERLDQSGRWMVDRHGRVAILRGFNMVNKMPPYTLSSAGFGEQDARLLVDHGFNAVRVGVIYSAVEPIPGQYNDLYLEDIERTVRMLNDHGIWSLIDLHQDLYGPVFQGEGMPEWATLTRNTQHVGLGRPAQFPTDYFKAPPVSQAFDSFWENHPVQVPGHGSSGLQDRYAAAWSYMAARFANVPGVLGYDMMNEPFPGRSWPECINPQHAQRCTFDSGPLTRFWTKVGTAIRKTDPRTLIFYEPNMQFDMNVPTNVGPVQGLAHLGFSFHPYGKIGTGLQNALDHSNKMGVALLATEWCGAVPGNSGDSKASLKSADDSDTSPVEFPKNILTHTTCGTHAGSDDSQKIQAIQDGTRLMDEFMMSWLYWTWGSNDPYPVKGLSGGSESQGIVPVLTARTRAPCRGESQSSGTCNLNTDQLEALARPFPRAVAGTPESFSYDPTSKIFKLTYKPVAVAGHSLTGGAQTEIVLPTRSSRYPRGYKVTVRGANVVSPVDAPVLRLVNEAGAPLVTVQVEPQ